MRAGEIMGKREVKRIEKHPVYFCRYQKPDSVVDAWDITESPAKLGCLDKDGSCLNDGFKCDAVRFRLVRDDEAQLD